MSQYGYQPFPAASAPPAKKGLSGWGIAAIVGGVVLALCLVCSVIGVVLWNKGVFDDAGVTEPQAESGTWDERLARVDGVTDHRDTVGTVPALHTEDPVSYPQTPPVGGDHHRVWQNCDGMVYAAPLVNEHAVHSLEHGVVWITYRPDLNSGEIAALERMVHGQNHLMMSPYPEQDSAISVQAWGFQLRADAAADPRIEAFIRHARANAGPEPSGPCTGGTTTTR